MESCNKLHYLCNRVLNNILILHPSTAPDLAAILKKWLRKSFLLISRLRLTLSENMSTHKITYVKFPIKTPLCIFLICCTVFVPSLRECLRLVFPTPNLPMQYSKSCLKGVLPLFSGLGQTVNAHWQNYHPCTQPSILITQPFRPVPRPDKLGRVAMVV